MADPTGSAAPDQLPEDLADLLFGRLLEVETTEQPAVLAELCRQHPAHAAAMRLAAFQLQGAERLLRGDAPADAPDLQTIGGLQVVRRLGEGAFGVVYLCRQQQPIRREVAVKVLRPGAGNRQTLARFEAERQVLALMQHPAIAHVHDAGALPDGRPYFVMEYVDGTPITAWCQRHRPAVTERLGLFLALCDGVEHAHRKGVIHRDLKPSNVLVVDLAGRPQPKIIDFGLAKALHSDPPPGIDATEAGRVLGTPGFMSPEQAAGRPQDVDTRSDVFSLGVILYAMLTGELPWRDPAHRGDDPVRPSTRLTSRSAEGPAGTETGSADRRRLAGEVRGDLDWIVLKALAHDRERRYQTVRELAEDLRRHLRHQPVLAGPPSTVYRLRKFCRRYRVQVLAAAAVLVALLAGLTLAFRYALVAQANLDRFEILALGRRLEQARASAAELHPPWPEQLPAYDDWLRDQGLPLRTELQRLRTALADLRLQALAPTPEQRAADLQRHPLSREIDKHRATIAYTEALLAHPMLQQPQFAPLRRNLEEARDRRQRELPDLERRRDGAGSWRFAGESQQFLHDTMRQLQDDLAVFCEGDESVVARVQRNRDQIQAIEVDGLAERLPLWQRATAEALTEPRYGGLRLRPQAGLVPLGRDPHSGLQEFYHPRSAPPATPVPERDARGELALTESTGIVFVLLPGGATRIGSQRDDESAPHFDPNAAIAETPVHQVTLAPFFLGKHEVTQHQWRALTGETPSHFHTKTADSQGRAINGRHPVENIVWEEAVRALAAQGLLLPTESQWEYACRAGTDTVWFTGNSAETLQGFANVADAAARGSIASEVESALDDGHSVHAPVGSFAPNAFGLHDMVGNVAEWCRDHFSSFAYLLEPLPGDGLHPVPEMQVRAARGGSFQDLAREGASAARHANTHNQRGAALGVRAARALQR